MLHEINLLPLSRRRSVAMGMLEGLFVHFLYSLIIGLVLVGGVAVAAAVGLNVLSITVSESLDNELASEVETYKDLRRSIADQNKRLKEMTTLQDQQVVWSDFFQEIFSVLPSQTTIQQFSGESEQRVITLRGRAATRNSLITIENRLKQFDWVERVEAPPSNLLERQNPEFLFLITVKGPQKK